MTVSEPVEIRDLPHFNDSSFSVVTTSWQQLTFFQYLYGFVN